MSTKSSFASFTPLMRASAIGLLDVVKELLEEGVDVNARGPRNSTALMFAAGAGHLDVVETLLRNGADINVCEDGGWNARRHAEEDGHRDIAQALSESEARRASFASSSRDRMV